MVDVGFGASPTTTLESYRRLRRGHPDLRVLGVEIDRGRVAAAAPHAVPGRVEFRVGGFDLALAAGERAGLIRAMNVLRQYEEHEHGPAMDVMARQLADGGLLLEGTSTPSGRLFTANLWRRIDGELVPLGVVLSVNLRRAWEPRELQTVLPKNSDPPRRTGRSGRRRVRRMGSCGGAGAVRHDSRRPRCSRGGTRCVPGVRWCRPAAGTARARLPDHAAAMSTTAAVATASATPWWRDSRSSSTTRASTSVLDG